jgi:hypothetical protein
MLAWDKEAWSACHARHSSGVDFACLDLICKDPKGKGTHKTRRCLRRRSVNQDTRELRNLRNPAAVRFLLELNGQRHQRPREYATARSLLKLDSRVGRSVALRPVTDAGRAIVAASHETRARRPGPDRSGSPTPRGSAGHAAQVVHQHLHVRLALPSAKMTQ